MINPFKKSYTSQEMNLFRFLSKIKIFEKLEYDEMILFQPFMHEREYNKEEVIFFRGDPSQALYILKKGEIVFNIDVNEEFEELVRIKDGSGFGESCLLENEKRLLNAIVVSETALLYVISKDNIRDIFENNVGIKAKMLESMGSVLMQYNANLFTAYKSSLGFFNLSQVYSNEKHRKSSSPS